jgi:hypothetical protein
MSLHDTVLGFVIVGLCYIILKVLFEVCYQIYESTIKRIKK